jgi:hypothetical protein
VARRNEFCLSAQALKAPAKTTAASISLLRDFGKFIDALPELEGRV